MPHYVTKPSKRCGRVSLYPTACGILLVCLPMSVAGPASTAADQVASNAIATEAIVDQWLAITDVVLARHVDPPTQQEMLKSAIQAVFQAAMLDAPIGLAATLSRTSDQQQLRDWLQATIERALEKNRLSPGKLRNVGTLAILRTSAELPALGLPNRRSSIQYLIPPGEFQVQRQLRDNQYVGIGIQLGMQDGYPTMVKVFPRGPAWNAGGRDGDQMISIDGHDAKDMSLARVIELLRGREGKPATVVVRGKDSVESKSLHMVRGVVPFDTVLGMSLEDTQHRRYRIEQDPRIAYLKFESIRGSTPAELRRISGKLHAEGCRALVLDLRRTQSGEMRYAVMIADSLLGAGMIGDVLEAGGRRTFTSSADQLFSGWPIAVVVNQSTVEQAEWIAAALHDNGRAFVVGQPTGGQGAVMELVELPGDIGGVRMKTGQLFRANGKPITVPTETVMGSATLEDLRQRELQGRAVRMMRRQGLKPDHEIAEPQMLTKAVRLLQIELDPESADESTADVFGLRRDR